eukprot:GEMP01034381.1.p1 GENE.GEMP01034381.1~~GEMP01034381.1.p1  ORF type:complete len:375 (+),score=72.97 GEMP01034381.1:31-1125(+)
MGQITERPVSPRLDTGSRAKMWLIICMICVLIAGATCVELWYPDKVFNALRRVFGPLAYHAYAYKHVRLVDALPNGSLVFRTGLPLDASWFRPLQFDETVLRALLRRAVEDPDLHIGLAKGATNATWDSASTLPLVDVTLLTLEVDAIEEEKRFFDTKGLPYELIQYPTNGVKSKDFYPQCAEAECATMQPRDLTPERRRQLAMSFPLWDPDDSISRIKQFINKVTTGPPRLYFFHCVCGCDRTGAFFLEYSLTRDPTRSFKDLLMTSVAVSDRSLFYEYQISAQWYCEHLTTIGVYKGNDCGACDNDKFRCMDTGMPFDWLMFDFLVKLLLIIVLVVLIPICCCVAYHRRTKRRRTLMEPFLG